MKNTLERIAFGTISLAGLIVLSDGIEAMKTAAQSAMKNVAYADGVALAAAGAVGAAYAGYLVVKDMYQEYKEQTKKK